MTYEFPLTTLRTSDATPRILPELAKELVELFAEAGELGIVDFPDRPAICVAIFTCSLVKWIVNEEEAGRTADNLREAIKKAKTAGSQKAKCGDGFGKANDKG